MSSMKELMNCNQSIRFAHVSHVPDLVVAPVLIQQRDDGFDVIFLDDVQHLWTLNQNTIQHLQDSCPNKYKYA